MVVGIFRMNILGIKIDNFSKEEVLKKIEVFLAGDRFCQIATVNPEFILAAQKNTEFKNILNHCDLNVADGTGIWFAFLRFGKYLKTRLAGADLMEEILKIADEKKLGIFLAANSGGLSTYQETRTAILEKYPAIKIGGADLNPEVTNAMNFELGIMNHDIVFCNFGAPYQEKFLHSLKNQENGKIRLVMGVGGSFDYLTRKVRRAPVLLRKFGLEWLWRLVQEPRYRLKRVWNAVVIFPIKILFFKNI